MSHTHLTLPAIAALLLGLASGVAQAAYRPAPTPRALQGVPLHLAPAQTVQKNLKAAAEEKTGALRFAVDASLSLGLADGSWDTPEAGMARWRAQVASVGAKTLSLEFAEFSLPEGAELWIYDVDGSVLQGPYTHANETPEGKLWTALIPAETLVMELRVPAALKNSVGLKLEKAHHGFLSFAKMGETSAKSGACNIDAVCPQSDGLSNEMRAAAMLTINNNFLCSGQLVNNVRGDEKPLLLTANHCNAGPNASSVVSYWNYQSSRCGGTPNGSLAQNIAGASLLAGDVGSDFTLLQLSRKPDASWNAYYAGWNAGAAAPQYGAAFHHPQGTEKRVSLYNTAASRSPVYINGNLVQAWAVKWSQGITESGSSGSGLYNESQQLVGVLSGGEASCSNPTGTDYFARLEAAFTANPEASGQLKAHLDPDNTGALSLNGKAPASAAPPVAEAPAAPAPTPAQPAATNAAPASGGGGGGGGSFGLNLILLLAVAFTAKQLRRQSLA